MKITILGSGTAVPSLTRNSSGILLQDEGVNTLFDFGYGTLRQLLRCGIDYHQIHRIFFTHNHPDHICDLIPFLFGSRYYHEPRTADLEIVAGPGFEDFFRQMTDVFGSWLKPTEYAIKIITQDEEERSYGSLRVLSKKVKHIAMSRGYRITDSKGAVLAISGDTDYCSSMIDLGRHADLMILECAFPDDMKCPGHLTPELASQLANEADCKRLCLTHFYPPCDLKKIREQIKFQGQLFLAADLMEFSI
jgi:ribonuclease BN (tRNA processing enzyme)